MDDNELKLLIAVITGLLAFIGTWIGSRFSRVNEHKQWLRDQKQEVYRECYQASQRWVESAERMHNQGMTRRELSDWIQKYDPATRPPELGPPPSDELAERKHELQALQDELDTLKQHFSEYGLLPVQLIAPRYVQAGVAAVQEAIPLPVIDGTEESFARELVAFRAAQKEMILRFRDDLDIGEPYKWLVAFRVARRQLREEKRLKRQEGANR